MELKNVIKFYIGCDVLQDDGETAKLIGVVEDEAYLIHDGTGSYGQCSFDKIKPILRPLSNMTKEEYIKSNYLKTTSNNYYKFLKVGAARFQYLLKQRFDLFGLIDSNQAISNPTLKPIE